MEQREGRPLLLIDLAVPRDIDPDCRELDGVSLHDVDDVQAIVRSGTPPGARPRRAGPARSSTPSCPASSAGSPRRR